MQKQRNKRRTESIKLKNRNRKPKRGIKKWRPWRQIKKMYDAIFTPSYSYFVEDTTQNRAPYFYQAPDLSSENPEEDYKKGMHIIDHRIEEWYFDDKGLLLKAANNGHTKAQFVLGHFTLDGWDYFETPDLNLAEVWLEEAIKNGLDGNELIIAQQDLQKLRAQREQERKWIAKGKGKIKYYKCFGRIYKR